MRPDIDPIVVRTTRAWWTPICSCSWTAAKFRNADVAARAGAARLRVVPPDAAAAEAAGRAAAPVDQIRCDALTRVCTASTIVASMPLLLPQVGVLQFAAQAAAQLTEPDAQGLRRVRLVTP
jgi:hypothetical protein